MSINAFMTDEIKSLMEKFRAECFSSTNHLSPSMKENALKRSKDFGRVIYCFEKSERLMPLARKEIMRLEDEERSLPSGCIWISESLQGAKGRMEREWWAPSGGIYFSMAMHPSLLRENWSLYNLGLGVALAQALRSEGAEVHIRWINDILFRGKKLAGILSEAFKSPITGDTYLILGAGLNVNIQKFPQHLPEATSLFLETGNPWHLNTLISRILANIAWTFGLLHEWEARSMEDEDLESPVNPILYAWNSLSDTPGRMVRYGLDADLNPEFTAFAEELNEKGYLILRLEDGEKVCVNTGEIRYL